MISASTVLYASAQGVCTTLHAPEALQQGPIALAQNAYDPDSELSDLYAEAEELYGEKNYDEVVQLLSGPCYSNPTLFELNVLLAKAQVNKCALLKARGDDSYKTLVLQPYETAMRFYKMGKVHPDLYYIAAKALFINDRPTRARKTAKKAVYFDPRNVESYLLLGDICTYMGDHDSNNERALKLLADALESYEKARELKRDDDEFISNLEKRIQYATEQIAVRKTVKGKDLM